MKCSLAFIGFVMYTFAVGQIPAAKMLRVGDAHNYLKIDTNGVQTEYYWQYEGKSYVSKQGYRYLISGDTLRILKPNFYDSSNRDYIIENLTNDELKLTSLNPSSRLLAFTEIENKVLTFRSQQKVYTDTINFQKIVFSSTTCYGSCPAMIFEISNNKKMNFKGEKYAVKQGFYSATLSAPLYSELLKTLAVSEMDKLENHGNFNIDLSTYTMEVHYNDKVKYIRTAFPPAVTYDLIKLLLEMPKRAELKESDPISISFSQ